MLPGHVLSSPAIPGTFLSPRNFMRSQEDGALTPRSIGGAGFQDASEGLASQVWSGTYDGTDCVLTPQTGAEISITIADVVWFDFCFDQSMNPVITWADVALGSHFRWFDSTISDFRITDLPVDTDPWPYSALDDSRAAEVSSSDVIITYTRSAGLYFLAQRDRYATEYHLGSVPAPAVLTQAGMSTGNRFQFQFNTIGVAATNIYGKYVPAAVFSPVMLINVGNIRPKIYEPQEDVTIRTRNR